MRRIVAALAVVGAVLAPSATVTGAPLARPVVAPHVVRAATPNPFGARVGFTQGSSLLWEPGNELARDLDGIVATGARWVAVDFDWPSAEPQRGFFDWSHIDRVVDAARARHLSVLALAVYTPAWARPDGTTDKTPPDDPNDYGAFVGAAAARYAPKGVHAWQIWNEPNVADFWQPFPDPARFAQLVIAGGDAIHAVDPHATVVAGGLAPAANVYGDSLAPGTFLEDTYTYGAGGHFDALGMHPYSFPAAPMAPAVWNPFFMLPWTHLLMEQHGDGAKRIWATEVGFGTGADGQSVSEATQAQRVGQLLAAWRQLPFAGVMLLYNYRDLGTTSSVWDHMGLVRTNGRAKPAFGVLARALAPVRAGPAHSWGTRVCVGVGPWRRVCHY